MKTQRKVQIFRDGVFAGDGFIDSEGRITCSAVLGPDQDASDDTYDELEDSYSPDAGSGPQIISVERPDGCYDVYLVE
jgi:hypothetical protein